MSTALVNPPQAGAPSPSALARWQRTKDGDPAGLALFQRHYSSDALFVGPGEKLVLLTADAKALFVWRKEKYRLDGQTGVNNAVFRNEGSAAGRASELIEAANAEAWARWPGERLFTFVDPAKVRRKRDPGRCFLRAGYRLCGVTKTGLLIFECFDPSTLPPQGGQTECSEVFRQELARALSCSDDDEESDIPELERLDDAVGDEFEEDEEEED